MTWDPVTKRALIADYVDQYFPAVDKKTRDAVSGMSRSTLETERFALDQALERQHTLGANAQKDIAKLRVMEFVAQCNGMALDPGDDLEAQKRMHKKLRLFADGKMNTTSANASLRHEKRMGARTESLNARDTVTFRL